MFKLTAGLAIGYVLGSRAGRDKYEQIAATARKVQAHPAVTQARQTVRARLGAPTPSSEPGTAEIQPAVVSGAPTPVPSQRRPQSAPTIVEPPA